MRSFVVLFSIGTVCLTLAACSKDVAVSAACKGALENEGRECDATADCPCGGEGACVAGVCRQRCGSDADCSGGANCVKDAIGRGGCLLTMEQSCGPENPCSPPLACGMDARCRVACSVSEQCPSNDQECLFGTCYGSNEAGTKPWICGADIDPGDTRCRDGKLQACNTTELGWSDVAACRSQALCEEGLAAGSTCAPPLCPAAGGYQCVGNQLQRCNDELTAWEAVDDCATPAICEQAKNTGRCAEPCEAGGECRGADIWLCRTDGTSFDPGEHCVSAAACLPGEAPRCTSTSTDVIDDFEDGDLDMLAHGSREGGWSAYADSFASVEIDNVAISNRGASERALSMSVSAGGYGVGLSARFAQQPTDLSDYAGLVFSARRASGEANADFRVELQDQYGMPSRFGGRCDETQDQCFVFFGAKVPLQSTWRTFGYAWAQLAQVAEFAQSGIPYSAPGPLSIDVAAVTDIAFKAAANGEFLIDDVALLRGSVGGDCDASEYLCEGSVLRRCNAQGNRHQLVDVCGTPTACTWAIEHGHCPEPCTPGAGQCRGRELWTCPESGDGLEYERTCNVAEACISGNAPRCLPGGTMTAFEGRDPNLLRLQGRNGDFAGFSCDGDAEKWALAFGGIRTRTNPWSYEGGAATRMGEERLLTSLLERAPEPGIATVAVHGGCGGLTGTFRQALKNAVTFEWRPAEYDASAYRAIRFRARAPVASAWQLALLDRATHPNGGTCGTGTNPACFQGMFARFDTTTDWTTHTISLDPTDGDLASPPWDPNATTTLDRRALYQFQISIGQAADAVLEIDDLEFVE